jgi:dipeptidase D
MNENPLTGVGPDTVWDFFYQISRIPRCSKNESAVTDWIINFAEKRNLEWQRDRVGNIVVRRSPSTGLEDRPMVVLQSHLDMVCEKNESIEHDFTTDPIKLVRHGDWLTADGTTLGADNGIGAAFSLALLDSEDISHGPIEALFTIDEETGLTGAMNLDPDLLNGKLLLNLDTEEFGVFYIGCAGGVTCEGELPITVKKIADLSGNTRFAALEIKITGFRGGHSGLDINRGLGNALSEAGRILMEISRETDLRLTAVSGGNKHNAIPRECKTRFIIPENEISKVQDMVSRLTDSIKKEYVDIEKDITIDLIETDIDALIYHPDCTRRVIRVMRAMPHGVYGMSRSIEGLVETSTNFAAIETVLDRPDPRVRVLTSQRSSVMSALDDIAARVKAVIELAGGVTRQFSRHPAWTPDPGSGLLAKCKAVYKEYTGEDADHTAIHAGLECGVIGDKIPGMEMISMGPEMEGAHTPQERVRISSVQKLWGFICELLKKI